VQEFATELRGLDASERLAYLRQSLDRLQSHARLSSARQRAGVGLQHAASSIRCRSRVAFRHARRHVKQAPRSLTALRAAVAGDNARKIVKSALFLAVAVIVGWGPMQRLMQTTSVEAIVNARLVTLRAPISGEVVLAPPATSAGNALSAGTQLVRIENRRADRTRLDELRRHIERLEDERAVLISRVGTARSLHAELVLQTQRFQAGRVQQLEARIDELKNELAAALARRNETAANLRRMSALAARGVVSRATLDKAQRDDDVALQAVNAAEQRIRASEVELSAARAGSFVGDSYNDRPRSAQRADELEQQLADLTAEVRQRELRLGRLRTELEEERARFADLAAASIVAPSTGSVWEVLTAPGEEVRQGQEVVRMLDCNSAVVTAAVSESVYNRLRIGQPARFRFREGGSEYAGRVVQLSGMAAAPANYAIAPSALIRESYRVTVAVPSLGHSATCHLGRTGRVLFGDPADDAAAAGGSG
jgi:multidrug resistance efflux pump